MSCNYWECEEIDRDTGECEETGSECLGDMCESFLECRKCVKRDGEECPEY